MLLPRRRVARVTEVVHPQSTISLEVDVRLKFLSNKKAQSDLNCKRECLVML